MIKYKDKLISFYKNLIRKERISYRKALSIYESLHKEALSLGVITTKDIQEGLEIDIRIAKTLNSLA